MKELSLTGFRGDSRYEDAGYPGDITSLQLECLIERCEAGKGLPVPVSPSAFLYLQGSKSRRAKL